MTKIGLKKLRCSDCGSEREVEVGIREVYCCAKPMDEVGDEEDQAEFEVRKVNPE